MQNIMKKTKEQIEKMTKDILDKVESERFLDDIVKRAKSSNGYFLTLTIREREKTLVHSTIGVDWLDKFTPHTFITLINNLGLANDVLKGLQKKSIDTSKKVLNII